MNMYEQLSMLSPWAEWLACTCAGLSLGGWMLMRMCSYLEKQKLGNQFIQALKVSLSFFFDIYLTEL